VTPAQARKRQERLTVNIQRVIDAGGISRSFVATFTTQANLSMDEFQSIWNSFMTNVLVRHLGKVGDDWKQHFHGVGVIEPQERGAPHMHLAGTVEEDVGAGVKWVRRFWKGKPQWLIARQSRPASLARLQAFLMRSWDAHVRAKTKQTEKKICNAHCMPVRTSARAAARYLAGYLEKGEARPGEWKGRRLYSEYGAYRTKNDAGETVVNSPHPCRGKFTRYALETRDGFRVREYSRLWRAQVAAFALEFGCSSLGELVTELGDSVLFQHRELIGLMVVPESSSAGFLRACRSVNRATIEGAGYNPDLRRTVQAKPRLLRSSRVAIFTSFAGEKFWSDSRDGKPDDLRLGELFPERLAVISSGEAALRATARRASERAGP
jgi:hypothetical protein